MSAPPAPQARTGDPSRRGDRLAPGSGSDADRSEAPSQPLVRLQDGLDRILVVDVFLVIAAALWFGIAVLLHARGVEAPLRLFQRLWEPVFTPAIGLLMAAALLSGALGWWRRRGQR